MTAFFDTSVLVPALVDQLSNHERCFATLRAYGAPEAMGYCSTHVLAECFSVLTALPLKRRVSPSDARRIIRTSIAGRLTVVALSAEDYLAAIDRVSERGGSSGLVYDALHLIAAERAECGRIYTYNVEHFRRLVATPAEVSAP